MEQFLVDTALYLHPITVHFPIGLLVTSVALDIAARVLSRPGLHQIARPLLWLGAIAALPATISGLIAHEPYEATAAGHALHEHLRLGVATTVLFGGLALWRWRTRTRETDIAVSRGYLALAVIGIVLLVETGEHGGELVYEYGINVKGADPLEIAEGVSGELGH